MKKETKALYLGGAAALGLGIVVYLLVHQKKNKLPSLKMGNHFPDVSHHARGKTMSEPNWKNPFDMNYEQEVKQWVAPQRLIGLTPQIAKQIAQELHQAKGESWWDDDNEETVKHIFQKRLRNKVQVAQLSGVFWNRYQKDLWQYLHGFLSQQEMTQYVHQPVGMLPNYQLL